jgi:hypothetical protein
LVRAGGGGAPSPQCVLSPQRRGRIFPQGEEEGPVDEDDFFAPLLFLFNFSVAPPRVKGFSNPLTISGRRLLRVPRRMGKRTAAGDLKKGNLSFSPHSFANYFSCT